MAGARYLPSVAAEDDAWAALDRDRQQVRVLREDPAVDVQARLVSAWRSAYPNVSPEVAVRAAQLGVQPASAEGRALAAADTRASHKRGWGLHSIGDVVQAGARVAFTALESPLQEVQSVIRGVGWAGVKTREEGELPFLSPAYARNVGEGLSAGGRSSAAIALRRLFSGDRVDLGSGYLPGGQVEAEQKRQAEQLQLDGRPISAGRVVAQRVTQPGTTPYNLVSGLLDAGVAWGADPVNVAGAAVGDAVKARKLFVADDAGRLLSHRPAVLAEVFDGWLHGRQGTRVVEHLAAEGDWYRTWKLMKGKAPVDVVTRIADEPTAEGVAAILREEVLGGVVRAKPRVSLLADVKPDLSGVRLLGPLFEAAAPTARRLASVVPARTIDLENADEAVSTLDRFLVNAKLPGDRIAQLTERMARSTSKTEKYAVVTDSLTEVMSLIEGGGVPTAAARRMTRMFSDYNERLAAFFVDEIGDHAPVLGAVIDGAGKALPTPHLYVEMINRAIPLPDPREIRRATSPVGRFLQEHPTVDLPLAALDWTMQQVWKPLALLRGAWTVRVVGEEQVRMAAAGMDSLISHPLRAIAWAAGRRGASDVLGEAFDAADDASEFAAALSRGSGGWRDRTVARGRGLFRKWDVEYPRAWADELSQLHADPIAKRVAGGWSPGDRVPDGLTGNHVEDVKRWFWEGPGKKFREEIGAAPRREAILADRAAADSYIDSIAERLDVKTVGDVSLRQWVATGRLAERAVHPTDLHDALRRVVDDGPEVVKGDLITVRSGRHAAAAEHLDRAVETMFSVLMSKPTNRLSRSPAFRQFYYQRVGELMSQLTDDAQRAVLSAARDAGLGDAAVRRLARRVTTGTGDIAFENVDMLAKGFALDETRKLLYDITEKSQWADISRTIFPFAEAWKEILTVWARLGVERPIVARRLQQMVDGARGAGFFQTDPQSQEEVFVYPGSGLVSGALTGVPVPFKAQVSSLNLFSQNPLIPGVGPAVQIPMAKLLPNKPEWDWVRDIVVPFGDPTEQGALAVVTPPWLRKFKTAMSSPESDRAFGSTVGDVAAYLVSTGDYSTDSPEEQERLSKAAVHKARLLFVLRGMVQFGAPAAPSFKMIAEDKDGRVVTAFKLRDEFRKLQAENYETAVSRFLETYGENALLYMQGGTTGGFSPTDALHDWVRDHPSQVSKFRRTYGFFAPTGGEFDFDEYERQIAVGERDKLSPRQMIELANARVAASAWRQARDAVGVKPNARQKALLAEYKEALVARFPGWNPESYDAGRVPALVRELALAVDDPELSSTAMGQAVRSYLAARDAALESARTRGLSSFGTAKSASDLRALLRDYAETLVDEQPAFLEVWERVFSRELVDDEEVTAGAQER